jgi:hypothetical protein
VAGHTHLPMVVEAGTHRLAAAVEAESHSEVAADSFREAVDSSLTSFSLLRNPASYGVSGAIWPPVSLR